MATLLVKRALRREEGYPVGVSAPVFVECCGTRVRIFLDGGQCAVCSTRYNAGGWVVATCEEPR